MALKLSVVIADKDAPKSAFVVWRDFEASIEKAARMGFKGVELALGEAADIDPRQLDAWLEKWGLQVSCISTGLTFARLGLYMTHSDEEKRREIIKLFKDLTLLAKNHGGMINVGRSRGFVAPDQTREESEGLFLSCMEEILPFAKAHGVTILIEPINRYESNFINSLDEATTLLKQLPCGNVGIMADLFHMNIEDDNIAGSLVRNRQYVKYIHIADSNRRAPGMGHMDFKAALTALRQMGYEGWLSAEVLPGDDPDKTAQAVVNYMRPVMEELDIWH